MTEAPHNFTNRLAASRRAFGRWLALIVVLVVWSPAGAPPRGSAQEAGLPEYTVKAAVLLNFARFTEWPEDAFSGPEAPLVVGVLGRESFGAELAELMMKQPLKNRPVQVRRLASDQEISRCQVLFIAASERNRYREILGCVGTLPILTVGETDDFPEAGGVLQLFLKRESNTVKFIVNLDAAKPARLKFSASLLKLADKVRGRYE